MKKQLVIIGVIVLLVCVGLSGCTETNTNGLSAEEQKFVGTWMYENGFTIILNADKTGKRDKFDCKWSLGNDGSTGNPQLILTIVQTEFRYDYYFTNNTCLYLDERVKLDHLGYHLYVKQ